MLLQLSALTNPTVRPLRGIGAGALALVVLTSLGCGGGGSDHAPEGDSSVAPAAGEATGPVPDDAGATSESDGDASANLTGALAGLRMSYDGAASMPEVPHLKNRCRFQEAATVAAIPLTDPVTIASWADGIHNWRRGAVYGQLALHLAQEGDEDGARKYLDTAMALEAAATEESVQGWRRDTIRLWIAKTYLELGDLEKAAKVQQVIGEAEAAQLARAAAAFIDLDTVDDQIALCVEISKTGDLDRVRGALGAVAAFYGRLYEDAERRESIETIVREGSAKIPVFPRIELLEVLAEADLAHGKKESCRAKVAEISDFVMQNNWSAEEQVGLRARLASWYARLGDKEKGVEVADEALARYDEISESILSIWRGRAIRPLAEAYHALGEELTASKLYERALVEAVVNPNSRPRAEELMEITVSIARTGLKPSEDLMAAVKRTRGQLGAPW